MFFGFFPPVWASWGRPRPLPATRGAMVLTMSLISQGVALGYNVLPFQGIRPVTKFNTGRMSVVLVFDEEPPDFTSGASFSAGGTGVLQI